MRFVIRSTPSYDKLSTIAKVAMGDPCGFEIAGTGVTLHQSICISNP